MLKKVKKSKIAHISQNLVRSSKVKNSTYYSKIMHETTPKAATNIVLTSMTHNYRQKSIISNLCQLMYKTRYFTNKNLVNFTEKPAQNTSYSTSNLSK